jgi:membrane protein implicated in regulation of membrane protease activity
MPSNGEQGRNLLIGVLLGALIGIIGNLTVGFFLRVWPVNFWNDITGLVIAGGVFYYLTRDLYQRVKTKGIKYNFYTTVRNKILERTGRIVGFTQVISSEGEVITSYRVNINGKDEMWPEEDIELVPLFPLGLG